MIANNTITNLSCTMTQLANKNILLGVSGGIAAYKSAELTRLFKRADADVTVVMTKSAQEFVQPLTFFTLSGNTVYTDATAFQQNLEAKITHISLARKADLIIVAPATANIIAKLAHGIADDLLSTICLATTAPIAIAPAMNQHMWQHPTTQENIAKLKQRGVYIFGPDTGMQACGDNGAGRMAEPTQLLDAAAALFANHHLLHQRKVVVTAGPTHEAIDGVRYLGNYSSGKMGYAIAQAAHEAGAAVTLISGPSQIPSPTNIDTIKVTTAQEMYNATLSTIKNNACDIFIAAAAVADYCPKNSCTQKIKRDAAATITLELEHTPDILAAVAALPTPPLTVGFAAETENLLQYANKKLVEKGIDFIVANQVGFHQEMQQAIGFNSDDNELTILQRNAPPITLPRASKTELARALIKIIAEAI
jgi:phosphopantothenoylcysteine decarboxylase / phosphopantothenate---cysteine ligase